MSDLYLLHHGIKGQRWGVRRFQNNDGTLTSAGKKRRSEERTPEEKKAHNKRIAVSVAATAATVAASAATAYYLKKHPEAIKAVADKAKSVNLKDVSKSTIEKGKNAAKTALKEAKNGFKEGVKEGIHDGPKKLGKAIVVGGVMIGGYKALEKATGSQKADAIFKANNPKKIDKFYKTGSNNSNDDED